MYATSYNFGSDPSNTKRKRVDSGPKNTAKKQIPTKRQKKTHNSEDDGITEEGSDGDDESNSDSDNDNDHDDDNDNDDKVVEEVDPVAEYEAMRESIQKERCVSSIFSPIYLLIFIRLLANIPIEDKTNVLKTYGLYILLEQWWLMARNVRVIGARFAGEFLLFHLP